MIPVILGLLAVGGILLVTRKKEPTPPEIPRAEIPTVDEIMGARDLGELNNYYRVINGLLTIGVLDSEAYMILYYAYYERWYQLIGGG